MTLAATALGLLIAYASLIGINGIVPDRPAEFTLDRDAAWRSPARSGSVPVCSRVSPGAPRGPERARRVPEAAMIRVGVDARS